MGLLASAAPGPMPALSADPTLSIDDVSKAEGNSGDTSFTFTVTLSARWAAPVSVNYATADGSTSPATAGSDYTAASGALTFLPGQTSKAVTIKVKGDTAVEPDETFVVTLSGPQGATLGKAQGIGTIQNDDGGPPPPCRSTT